jgi:hypothetical protein
MSSDGGGAAMCVSPVSLMRSLMFSCAPQFSALHEHSPSLAVDAIIALRRSRHLLSRF